MAPIRGRVSRRNVTVGNLIQVGAAGSTPLTTLVSEDPMYVYFDVDERTMLRYQDHYRRQRSAVGAADVKALAIPVEIGLADEGGYARTGVLDFVDNRVDPATGSLLARGVFDNADYSLTPGLFVRVRMPFGRPRSAVLVTERAVGTDQGGKFLFVANEQNVVEYRPVKLGPLDQGLRVIEDGVAGGEWVITSGIQRVRPGLTVTPQRTAMVPHAGGAGGEDPAATTAPNPAEGPAR
jgi:multidrug efflux system membrane fusion protein